ncbi:MAG: NERD domain-containing protein [bacterium]|nr:NERD domain-containing protein [bacterium]
MAIMIPTNPREYDPKSHEGEMFEALEKLPDDYYVVHSLEIVRNKNNCLSTGEADFVIFNRKKGMLFLEAKATKAKYSNGCWYYADGREMHSGGPFKQAERNKYAIRDLMIDRGMQNLIDKCKLLHAVWFPMVAKKDIDNIKSWPADSPKDLILTQEDLADPTTHIEKIFDLKVPSKIETELSEKEAQKILDEIICPKFEIAPSIYSAKNKTEIIFHKLLKEQSLILKFLEEQHTVTINGAAGTGKTLIALEKAKQLAANGEKVLFLCFNKMLKTYLDSQYKNENIKFLTIAGFCCSMCNSSKTDYSKLNDILTDIYFNGSFPYKHIIIDEGQDFGIPDIANNKILETLKTIIEDKQQGCFYIYYDRTQLIQADVLPDILKDADCKLTLYRNCRNTKNIAQTSLSVINGSKLKLKDSSIEGSRATMHFCNEDNIVSVIDNIIDTLINEKKLDPKEIIILTCNTESYNVFQKSYPEDYKYIISEDQSDHEIKYYNKGNQKIRFTTCRKFKGLESEAVILVDIDEQHLTGKFASADKKVSAQKQTPENTENAQEQLIFYAGTSRARTQLDLVTTMNKEQCKSILDEFAKKGLTSTSTAKDARKRLASLLNADAITHE